MQVIPSRLVCWQSCLGEHGRWHTSQSPCNCSVSLSERKFDRAKPQLLRSINRNLDVEFHLQAMMCLRHKRCTARGLQSWSDLNTSGRWSYSMWVAHTESRHRVAAVARHVTAKLSSFSSYAIIDSLRYSPNHDFDEH